MKQGSSIKNSLKGHWDTLKDQFPVVVDLEAVKGDKVKENFLNYIDGLKTAEEVGKYFTLDASETMLIFSDLIGLRAIRFLDDVERLQYLKQQGLELKRNIDFLLNENHRLKGEDLYLSTQMREKNQTRVGIEEEITLYQESLKETKAKLGDTENRATEIWESNSELLSIAKDMRGREAQITGVLEKIEREYPKVVRKKERLVRQLNKNNGAAAAKSADNQELEQTLHAYYDVVSEVHDYLEEAKFRVNFLMKGT